MCSSLLAALTHVRAARGLCRRSGGDGGGGWDSASGGPRDLPPRTRSPDTARRPRQIGGAPRKRAATQPQICVFPRTTHLAAPRGRPVCLSPSATPPWGSGADVFVGAALRVPCRSHAGASRAEPLVTAPECRPRRGTLRPVATTRMCACPPRSAAPLCAGAAVRRRDPAPPRALGVTTRARARTGRAAHGSRPAPPAPCSITSDFLTQFNREKASIEQTIDAVM